VTAIDPHCISDKRQNINRQKNYIDCETHDKTHLEQLRSGWAKSFGEEMTK